MEPEPITFIWRREDEAERPDKVLSAALSLSRTQLQAWMKAGLVRCAGRTLGPRDNLREGDEILILPPAPRPLELEAEEGDLDILFEDRDLLVLNKKAGDVVHPGAGHFEGTLVHALLHHCKGELSGIGGVERPGIVHRLDRETSGVMVVAKNDQAHQSLSAQFKDRCTEKFYSAFVLGKMLRPSGEWNGPIGRHPRQRQKMAVLENGREARTRFEVERAYVRATRLRLQIFTGRTHQIRVHAATAGFPVLGDTVYGRKVSWAGEAGIDRQLLHAKKLVFEHPRSGQRLTMEAPEPEIFDRVEKFLARG